jgi:hypothetical protein
VLQNVPGKDVLEGLSILKLNGIVAHCEEAQLKLLYETLKLASLEPISTITAIRSGYLIHGQASAVVEC